MNAKQMWNSYIEKYSENKDKTYNAWCFGNDEKLANELGNLVKRGIKTATASGLCFYEFENEELPKVGSFNIILDWNEEAQCVIQLTKVYTTPFNEVSQEHAFKEGEGDKSLLYWKNVHKAFFSEELKPYGKDFDENMLVVCEEFKVVWK